MFKIVFVNRHLRRKQEEAQRETAGCLNVLTNLVVVWNTVHSQEVLKSLQANGLTVATKPQPTSQRRQLFALIQLALNPSAQERALQVTKNKRGRPKKTACRCPSRATGRS